MARQNTAEVKKTVPPLKSENDQVTTKNNATGMRKSCQNIFQHTRCLSQARKLGGMWQEGHPA